MSTDDTYYVPYAVAAEITEADVIQFLQAQREKHGLTCLQLMIHAPIEAKPGIHGGIPARASVFAHTTDQLGNGETISEALINLHETTQ